MKPLVKLLNGLMASLYVIGSIWVLLLMLLITVDVIGRYFFNAPLSGVPEIVKVSVVGLVWCQIAYTLKIGAHMRSTLLLDRMPPTARRLVEIVSCVSGAIIFALIVYTGWDPMIEAWRIGEFEGELPARVPTYPIRSLVLIGAALTAAQFLVMLVDLIRGKSLHRDEAET